MTLNYQLPVLDEYDEAATYTVCATAQDWYVAHDSRHRKGWMLDRKKVTAARVIILN